MEMAIFFVLAVLAVLAGVGVIAQRSAMRSALFLLVNFCCLAGLYILLNAQFVAIVQVMIYAGAVVVLFLFVVMLLGVERVEETPDLRRTHMLWPIAGVLLGALFLAGIVWALIAAKAGPVQALTRTDNVRQIGAALLTDLIVPFELTAVVLLVAVIGAVVLAKKKLEG
jgi:NADH-quinone oxidoreductase subunit J